MPEKIDSLVIALLVDRPLCWACLADRLGLTREGAQAAVDHLDQTVRVGHRGADRCRACGHHGETIGIDRPVGRRDRS
jgi:hypothetical protein